VTVGRRIVLAGLLAAAVVFAGVRPGSADDLSRRKRHRMAAEARELMDKGRFAEAAPLLETAAAGAREKDLARWLPLLGRSHEKSGHFSKALTAYQDAYRLRPKSVDRMLDLARVYVRVDLYDSAIELYRRVLEREKRRDVVLILAGLYHKTGKLDAAETEATRYLSWEPQDLTAHRLLAEIEEDQGDLAAAAHRWEGVLSRDPSAAGYFHLGRLWSRQNQYELAERAFRKAEGLGMVSPLLVLQRGLLAWLQGDPDAAGTSWEKAGGDNYLAPFFLALRDAEKGRTASALERMRRAERASTPYVKDLARIFIDSVQENADTKP
jgi:tetratricopeptide (TPR) repeat protein